MDNCSVNLSDEDLLTSVSNLNNRNGSNNNDSVSPLILLPNSNLSSPARTKPKGAKGNNNQCKWVPRWEKDPILKTWIRRPADPNGKVVCRFCDSLVRCKKTDLMEHTRTLRHQKSFKENCTPQEFDDFVKMLNKEGSGKRERKSNVKEPPTPSFDWNTMLNLNTNNNNSSLSTTGSNHTSTGPNTPVPSELLIGNESEEVTSAPFENVAISTAATTIYTENGTVIDPSIIGRPMLVNSIATTGNSLTTVYSTATTSTAAPASPSSTVDFGDLFGGGEDYITNVPAADSPRDLVTVILEDQLSPQPSSSFSSSELISSPSTANLQFFDSLHEEFCRTASSPSTVFQEPLRSHNLQLSSTHRNSSNNDDPQMNFVFDNSLLFQPDASSFTEVTSINTTPSTAGATATTTTTTRFTLPSSICTPAEFINAVQNNYFTMDDVCSVAVACISHVKNLVNLLNLQTISIDEFSGPSYSSIITNTSNSNNNTSELESQGNSSSISHLSTPTNTTSKSTPKLNNRKKKEPKPTGRSRKRKSDSISV